MENLQPLRHRLQSRTNSRLPRTKIARSVAVYLFLGFWHQFLFAQATAQNAPLDIGKLTGETYRNSSFSFTYKLPYAWVERTSALNDEQSDPSKERVLLAAFEHPPEVKGDTVNSAVIIAAENTASFPGLK